MQDNETPAEIFRHSLRIPTPMQPLSDAAFYRSEQNPQGSEQIELVAESIASAGKE